MTQITVPYVALGLRARRVKHELMTAIERVIDSGMYVLGPDVAEFETRFAAYCGTRYAVGVADGTSALILTLRSLGVGPGDEVITAPNSFAASASSSALLGATPRFVDVRREDMNMDPARLEAAITRRTKAIVPVHLTGAPADMEPILKVAERHGIPVVEDAAQSVGTTYNGRRTGSMGYAGCFSLHPLKNLHGVGDAGVVTTSDERLYRWLLKARNHGLRNRDEIEFWSTNSRLDTLQAAILNVMLDHLDAWIAERRAIAAEYGAALRGVVGVPRETPGSLHTYQTFMIQAERRPELLEHLKSRGVDAKVHYPLAIPMQEAARDLHVSMDEFPVTRWLVDRIVSLPLYAEMTAEQRAAVIDGVRSFYRP
ncbi:MAG TPA: DegT/DnrJ/EryC1/StrS family aminotransferase [Methylomirabilota bacterium]